MAKRVSSMWILADCIDRSRILWRASVQGQYGILESAPVEIRRSAVATFLQPFSSSDFQLVRVCPSSLHLSVAPNPTVRFRNMLAEVQQAKGMWNRLRLQ